MTHDYIKPTGQLNITLIDAAGQIKFQTTVSNLIVTTGKVVAANRLIGNVSGDNAAMSHMGVGTDGGTILPLAASNTTLGSALGTRQSVSSSVSDNVVTYSATFGPDVATGAITEAGVFNASTSGKMLCRTTFPEINKESTDTLSINWNVTIN